jgi:predicted dehydrogenase
MNSKSGIGIVGCGMIANVHCRAIAEIENARLIGCVSSRYESAVSLAEKWRGRPYRDLDQMLADPDIDIVSICTPSGSHLEPALAAARAGKHVIVEKPLEISVRRCDQLIKACQSNGLLLTTVFPSRFHAASRILKQAVDQERFGKLTLGEAHVKWFRTQAYYDSGKWRGTWEFDGGGALMNQAIHSVDLLSWLMGPVDEVSAHTATLAHERIEVEDVATVSLRFRNGALGTIVATTAAYPGMLKRIEIHGSRGTAVLEEEDLKVWSFADATAEDESIRAGYASKTRSGGGAADPSAIGHTAHAAQIRDFIYAIESGGRPAIDGAEGRRSVQIIEAIYEAARAGKSVRVE